MNKQPIVHEQFIRSMIKWLAKADNTMINKFCAIMTLENPELANDVSERLNFAKKRKIKKENGDE
jgi:hypothetical protein